MRKIVYVRTNEQNKEFYYINLGAEDHFRPTYKLWIPKRLIKKCEATGDLYLQFPIKGVRVEKGKNSLILKPGRFNLFYYFLRSGDRGEVDVEINDIEKTIMAYAFRKFESPRAALGISKEIFVLTTSNCLEIGWSRTGFTGNRPKKGVTRICFDDYGYDYDTKTVNAEVEVIEDIDLEGLKRLTNLLELTTECNIYE